MSAGGGGLQGLNGPDVDVGVLSLCSPQVNTDVTAPQYGLPPCKLQSSRLSSVLSVIHLSDDKSRSSSIPSGSFAHMFALFICPQCDPSALDVARPANVNATSTSPLVTLPTETSHYDTVVSVHSCD
ncbi:hypothetical protein J6590_021161 [Homalodisca vitripennis]|nr:hypothetical protein J6590_021161 [Homalodisca vitripennis]